MIQVLPPTKKGFGKGFQEAFEPTFTSTLKNLLSEAADIRKEKRKSAAQSSISKGTTGIDLPLDSSTVNTLIKENQKTEERQELMRALGLAGDENAGENRGISRFMGNQENIRGNSLLENGLEEGGRELERERGPEEGRERGFNPQNYSDEQLMMLAMQHPQVASMLQKTRGDAGAREDRRFEKDRDYHAKATTGIRKTMEEMLLKQPKNQAALTHARTAINSDDIGFFSMSHIGELFGFDGLQNASASTLKVAAKENILSNLSNVSAKGLNRWLEQQINSMFPQIGKSKSANNASLTMLEGEAELSQLMLDEFGRLSEHDNRVHGSERSDILLRMNSNVGDDLQNSIKKTSYRLRTNFEREKGDEFLKENLNKKVLSGTPMTKRTAMLFNKKYGNEAKQKAKELGYTILSKDLLNELRNKDQLD